MRHIIIAFAISIFSLSGFANGNLSYNQVSNFYDHHKLIPNACNFGAIPLNDLKEIVLEFIGTGHLKIDKGDSAESDSVEFVHSDRKGSSGIISELDQKCKKVASQNTGATTPTTKNTDSPKAETNEPSKPFVLGTVAVSTALSKNKAPIKTDSTSTVCTMKNGVVPPGCPSANATGKAADSSATASTATPPPAHLTKTVLPENDGELPPPVSASDPSSPYGLNPQSSLDGESTMFTNTVGGKKSVVTINNETGKTSTQSYNADGTKDGRPTKGIDPHWPAEACKNNFVSADDCEKIKNKSDAEMDPAAQAAADAKLEKNAGEYAELQQKVTSIDHNINAACSGLVSSAAICNEAVVLLAKITKLIGIAGVKQKICDGSSSKAKFLCPLATSPTAQAAGIVMNGLSAMIPNMSSASKTCQVTSKTNFIGQGILGGGLLLCGASKFICEGSCTKTNLSLASAETSIVGLNALFIKIETAAYAELSKDQVANPESAEKLITVRTNLAQASATAKTALGTTTPKQASNATVLGDCKKHAVDMKQMATTMAGMGAAAFQAKSCEEKLAALDKTGNSGQKTSMESMCAQPANASTIICKCRLDNTAVGCPGHISANLGGGNLVKNLGGKGPAGMIGMSSGKPFGPKGLGDGLDGDLGLSEEAEKALSVNADSAIDSSFSAAAGANAGGASGGGGGSASAASTEKSKAEPKSFAGSFISAIGSLFKGGSGAKAAGAKSDAIKSDKYNVQRQIANEQMRNEISGSSGIDNWTKVKTRYKNNSSSLIAE